MLDNRWYATCARRRRRTARGEQGEGVQPRHRPLSYPNGEGRGNGCGVRTVLTTRTRVHTFAEPSMPKISLRRLLSKLTVLALSASPAVVNATPDARLTVDDSEL